MGTERVNKMAGATWTDEETTKLIEIWGEEEIQEGCKRNIHVYERIARELCDIGYKRTAVQCREKLKKLKSEYKKIKDNNKRQVGKESTGDSMMLSIMYSRMSLIRTRWDRRVFR